MAEEEGIVDVVSPPSVDHHQPEGSGTTDQYRNDTDLEAVTFLNRYAVASGPEQNKPESSMPKYQEGFKKTDIDQLDQETKPIQVDGDVRVVKQEGLKEREIEECDDDEERRKGRKAVVSREGELEEEVTRLQSDVVTLIMEMEEAESERRELGGAYEELMKSNEEKEFKLCSLAQDSKLNNDSLMRDFPGSSKPIKTIVNSVASSSSSSSDVKENLLTAQERNDLEKNVTKVSERNRYFEGVEKKVSTLILEIQKRNEKLKVLKETPLEFGDRSDEECKALKLISDQAVELQIDLSRLQVDLALLMSNTEEAAAKFQRMRTVLKELKQSDRKKELKIGNVVNKEIAPIEDSKVEHGSQMRDSGSKAVVNFSIENSSLGEGTKPILGDEEILIHRPEEGIEHLELRMKRSLDLHNSQMKNKETGAVKSLYEEAMKQTREEWKEKETRIKQLRDRFEKTRKAIGELNAKKMEKLSAKDAEKRLKLKRVAGGAALVVCGGILAAAAALFYLSHTRPR